MFLSIPCMQCSCPSPAYKYTVLFSAHLPAVFFPAACSVLACRLQCSCLPPACSFAYRLHAVFLPTTFLLCSCPRRLPAVFLPAFFCLLCSCLPPARSVLACRRLHAVSCLPPVCCVLFCPPACIVLAYRLFAVFLPPPPAFSVFTCLFLLAVFLPAACLQCFYLSFTACSVLTCFFLFAVFLPAACLQYSCLPLCCFVLVMHPPPCHNQPAFTILLPAVIRLSVYLPASSCIPACLLLHACFLACHNSCILDCRCPLAFSPRPVKCRGWENLFLFLNWRNFVYFRLFGSSGSAWGNA